MLRAEGTVKSCDAGKVVLLPSGTTYELHLQTSASLPVGNLVRGMVNLVGRKVWTVSAGGGFITPILGEPRVIQGRILAVEGNRILVQAGTVVSIDLPQGKSAMDLKNGPLTPGVMVNATIKPGASFSPAA